MYLIAKFLREPLVLFSLTAAFVFGLHALAAPDRGQTIEITSATIDAAVENREMLISRGLTAKEHEELVEQILNQEILVREAVAKGIHLHDSKTRARLVTQMHFVMSEDAPEPSSEDLARLQAQDPERYMLPKTVSFDHVFFEKDKLAALALKSRIDAGEIVAEDTGDRFWLGNRMEFYTAPQILTVLGSGFATELMDLTPGVWSGPIRSGRGWHLVRLDAFHPAAPLPQADLERVLREVWKKEFREATFNAQLNEMRAAYRIVLPEESASSETDVASLDGE